MGSVKVGIFRLHLCSSVFTLDDSFFSSAILESMKLSM